MSVARGGEGYDVVCPDPPWWYGEMPRENSGVDYPLMKLEELVAMRPLIDSWAAENCALPMWFTGPHLPTAIDLGRAWGFEYVTVLLTWCKTGPHDVNQCRLPIDDLSPDAFNVYPGSGRYTRHATEYLGLWRRGRLPPPADRTVRQVIHAPVREHSRKPPEARLAIERLWPKARRLEVFARERFDGWDAWGNQVDKFNPASGQTAPIAEPPRVTTEPDPHLPGQGSLFG